MYNSIFQRPWWLEAVAPDQWYEIIIRENNQIVARMPYVLYKRYGCKFITMPPLTQTLGPWIKRTSRKYCTTIKREKKIFNDIIGQLPKFDSFCQAFHYSITNWLPFYWKGYQQTTQYTYVIKDLKNLEKIWNDFSNNTRRNINAAKKHRLKVTREENIQWLFSVMENVFRKQNLKIPFDKNLVEQVHRACKAQNASAMFTALDDTNTIHASYYLIWDQNAAYLILGGIDPQLGYSGGGSLCIWEAIKYASELTRRFDFEGSMIESVEKFFRGFGAKQQGYFKISKSIKNPFKLCFLKGRKLVTTIRSSAHQKPTCELKK
jgi:hypothetical protein